MGVLKTVVGALPVVIILSIAVWVIMYFAFPDAPLTAAETTLVVFVITVIGAAIQAYRKARKAVKAEANNEKAH